MICFRDKTFCSSQTCANTDCGRNFTPALAEAAVRWWGGPEAPVAFADFEDGCQNYMPRPAEEAVLG